MPKGQTLLEVIISAAIIVTGIVSLVSLIISIQSSSRLTYQEAIALGLAQEAIEAARFIRDSNWLEREAGTGANFYDGLYSTSGGTTDYTAIYRWRPPQTDPALAVTFDFIPDDDTHSAVVVYSENASGRYRQTTGSTTGLTATPYSRFITLYPVCSTDGGLTETVLTADGETCAAISSTQIGIQVLSQVSWENSGETMKRVLEERLYDWKYAD